MKKQILVVGCGVLADTVCRLLQSQGLYDILRRTEVTFEVPANAHLALVLDDGWQPDVHAKSEEVFRSRRIPWLRAFVAFGNGYMGPLVRPDTAGCSHCADMRMMMALADRQEMFQARMQLAIAGGKATDAWSTRTAMVHMAQLLVAQVRILEASDATCLVEEHMIRCNLMTLETTRHFILPNAACPNCGSTMEDSPESAVIEFYPRPKVHEDSFRVTALHEMETNLHHDYLDYEMGLMNAKVQDLITPFAGVSVNLPLLVGDEGTSGKAHVYDECEPIAILEGLERFCGIEPRGKQTIVYDSYANLKANALNPEGVGLHAPEAYSYPEFPFQAFDADMPMGWVWGYSLTEKRPILVPERLAYYSLGRDGFVYETSNGCAVGGDLVEAIFHGMLEIVERDAFLMTWYAKLPLPEIDISSIEDIELQWMILRLKYVAGYDLHCFNATMENQIPSVFVVAKNCKSTGLNLLCAAGSHVNPMRALKGAIQENAGMLLRFDDKLAEQQDEYLRMLQDASLVQQMEQHSMLYGLREAEDRLAFLLDKSKRLTPVQSFEEAFQCASKHVDLTEDLKDLLTTFERLNLDVIVVNQTSPELERNGLYCVKVIIPGMLPMTFGHHLRRLDGLERVLTVPMKLGYTDAPLSPEQLNPYPHPFP